MIMATGHSDKEAYFDNAEDSIDEPQLTLAKQSSNWLKMSVGKAVENDSFCSSKETRLHEVSAAVEVSNEILVDSAAHGAVQRANDPVDR